MKNSSVVLFGFAANKHILSGNLSVRMSDHVTSSYRHITDCSCEDLLLVFDKTFGTQSLNCDNNHK